MAAGEVMHGAQWKVTRALGGRANGRVGEPKIEREGLRIKRLGCLQPLVS